MFFLFLFMYNYLILYILEYYSYDCVYEIREFTTSMEDDPIR